MVQHGGELGTGLAAAVIAEMSVATKADGFVPITGAHIDGCLFHGQAGLDFAEALLGEGARVKVPTTLNVSSLDLLHPSLYRGDATTAASARRLMEVYEAMGCEPTWTCAPYQLQHRPGFGEQIAWAESNAIVFANSVLGARTNRYGDFLDIACAVTGLAPYYGLHTDQGRRGTVVVRVVGIDSDWLDSDWLYPVLGSLLGRLSPTGLPVIVGLDQRASEDRLKALGAGAASTGAIAMFHAVGVTPEAATMTDATGGVDLPEFTVGPQQLSDERARLSSNQGQPPQAVSLGAPHYSAAELSRLAERIGDRTSVMPFFVNTNRAAVAAVPEVAQRLAQRGVTVVTDTCTYITPIIDTSIRVVMTDSAKWAYYAPGNLGIGVVFGSAEECVATAVGDLP
ncbi:MAG TPA: aconitase X catalytic domain-containing protein [Acidimicrobiia bacterium]|nr:aconitase X catalytic domain-containing protein [Acidimicrobiia bacterium]